MGQLLPILSIGAGLLGQGQQQRQANAAANAAQQGESNFMDIINQMLPIAQSMQQNAGQYNAPLGGASATMSGLSSGLAGALPGMFSRFAGASTDPRVLAAMTGLNAPGAVNSAMQYSGAPGSTNLAGATPGVLDFYAKQMQQGIDPRFASNAQDQLQQNFQRSLGALDASARPGQNLGAQQREMQNSMLTQSANLGGQLAGESQQLAGQGAQGMLGAAGGLDAQTLAMLNNAAQLGMGYNQQAFGNMQTGLNEGQSMEQQIMNFLGMGNSLQEGALSGFGNVAGMLGNQAQNMMSGAGAAQAAAGNPWSTVAQGLSSMSGMNFGGGGKAPGGGLNFGSMSPGQLPAGFGQSGNVAGGLNFGSMSPGQLPEGFGADNWWQGMSG